MLYLLVSDIVVSVMFGPYFKMYYPRDASTCGQIMNNSMIGIEVLMSVAMILLTYLEWKFITSESVK